MLRWFILLPLPLLLAADPVREFPVVPRESYKRVIETESASLKKRLSNLAEEKSPKKGTIHATKAVAMMLVRYADATSNDGLKSQALLIVRKIDDADWKGAAEAAGKLENAKADPRVLMAVFPKMSNDDIWTPFRLATHDGLNIEKDIRVQALEVSDVRLVELVGVRTAALAVYVADMPPVLGKHMFPQSKWDRWVREMGGLGREVAAEASKGDKANKPILAKLLKRLNDSCSNCHQTDLDRY